jgi:hypothetical protein
VTISGSDRSNLARVGKAAKAVMRTAALEAVADRGYFNSPEILECHEAGITVTLPKPMTSGAKAAGQRLASKDLMMAGQLSANTIATAPATAAQVSELARSEPFCQPYVTLIAPDAPVKIAAEK